MALIIASTDWSWALPLVGPAAALFGAMAAINTYALDGTALWQLLTTPGALKADVRGRMVAWALLFGLPSIALAAMLWAVTGSWWGSVLAAVLLAAVVLGVSPALTVRLLQQRGTGLLEAMTSRDTAALRSAARTRGPLTRPRGTRSHHGLGGTS